ncbi:LPXTG cell wall anchor domain-containing protein [Enterococcus faecium]|uniref:LPXTG cell wall anchor domain-containing protein n=1 Tax=Enterococcus faecium TaxID=1352 RepID=UPI000BF20E16|nr:LPXTG cell wall anchor domain-containing protein [Enterococcus faecium]PEH49555.1 hypothetical protein CRM75_02010 [Enterococcus faecium]
MKRISKILFISFLVIIFYFQVTTSQEVVASTEKSQVGITFEGSLPQTSENTTNGSQNRDLQSSNKGIKINQKHFPKTNDRKNHLLTIIGFGFIVIVLCLIGWKKKKERKI